MPLGALGVQDVSLSLLRETRSTIPGAYDVFVGPLSDWFVVLVPGELRSYLGRPGQPGAEALRVALSGRVVMEEWAIGSNAKRWATEASRLLKRSSRPAPPKKQLELTKPR